jgi:hypothetical protein
MKWPERQDLNLSTGLDNQGVTAGDRQGDSQTAVASLHGLSQVVNFRPRLSASLKAAIPAIASSVTNKEGD